MSDTTNGQGKARLLARLEYLKELLQVQVEQSEKSILEIADIAEKLGIHPDIVKSVRNLASIVNGVKDGLVNAATINHYKISERSRR